MSDELNVVVRTACAMARSVGMCPDLLPTSPLRVLFQALFAGGVVHMESRAGLAPVRRGLCMVVVHLHIMLERHRCNDACGRP